MGLSAAKSRTKLSADPNNTAWSKSTSGFGHKILSAQGWKPGDYLGAENASHADHYTAANASHIRVMLREENLGLGAQIGKGNAETFGLSMFSGLLGRLNGKVEVVSEAQQKARQDAMVRIQHEQKYGFLNFVSGGFLIGDKIERKGDRQAAGHPALVSTKKRKAEGSEDVPVNEIPNKKAKTHGSPLSTSKCSGELPKVSDMSSKNPRESVVAVPDTVPEQRDANDTQSEEGVPEKLRKDKCRKAAKQAEGSEELDQKAVVKQDRRARKEERRKRKEEKEARRQRREEKRHKKATAEKLKAEQRAAVETMPSPSVPSSVVLSNGSRHATRQRYIQQKRMASMDPKALKEIFMLQATASGT